MRLSSGPSLALAMAVCLILPSSAGAASGASIVSQQSTVHATADACAGGTCDNETSDDGNGVIGDWDGSASAHANVPGAFGFGEAQQSTEVSEADGSVSVHTESDIDFSVGGSASDRNVSGTASSVLEVEFDVAGGSVSYFVTGSFNEPVDTAEREGVVELECDGSTLVQVSSDTQQNFSESGTIGPGATCLLTADGHGSTTDAANSDGGLNMGFGAEPLADTDGDGLPDTWEAAGIDFTDDGTIELDLPAMGADSRHKDVFLEIDHMAGHALSQEAIDDVVAAFAAAPVANPDGEPGVTLHVDNGPASPMSPPSAQTWGALSDADTLTHQDVLGTKPPKGEYDWTAFDLLKAGNFSIHREPAFHYVVSGHRYGAAAESSSGVSRGFGASDLLVTLGAASEPGEGSGTVGQQEGTLMHELGHNLGLHHGGDDETNYKPSYLSIMNYSFQFTGLGLADGTTRLDYSRFGVSLDEHFLDEINGFGFAAGSEGSRFVTVRKCTNGELFLAPLLAGPVDWDCSGEVTGLVPANLNGDSELTAFTPFLDWPALVYDGGSIGDAEGASLPQTTKLIEPQLDELLDNQRVLENGVFGPTARPAPGAPPAGPSGVTAPRVTLGGAKSQKLGKAITVTVTCSEECTASAAGIVTVPNASRAFRVSSPKVSLVKGGSALLRLKLSGKLRGAAKRALIKGKGVRAMVSVTVENAGGLGTAKRSIRLKA